METSDERFRDIVKIGSHRQWTQDFYHTLMIIGWGRFFFIFVGFFLLFNILFGFCYLISPSAIGGSNGSFWQAFLFSVQTFSTVGYGIFHPQSNWAHVIVVVESILSVFVTAVLTGLIFSKFARPSARILFSKNILIHNFGGQRMLTLRVGNLRSNHISEAQVKMVILVSEVTVEGQRIRRQIDLNLARSTSLFFAITWSIMHVIDESSPLYNVNLKECSEKDIEIGVSITGNDSTFSQTVHANCIYQAQDIIFDRYFEDVIESKNGKLSTIHYEKFHDLQK